MNLNVNEEQRIRTLSSKADGDKIWFVDIYALQDDLYNQDIDICDKNNNVLFTLKDSTIEQASYICSINNAFNRMFKETK